ncbi:MAG: histidine--tRNA ligase [Syntrophales bacterium]|nr:histidine--tRNA ligase [Syntrophales bacterium]
MNIKAVKGFKDILPQDSPKWRFVEEKAREIFSHFGFREIRVPVLEKTELFRRSIGESTDIVEKEMYTFLDKSDEYLSLRPEATASIIRAFIEHHLYTVDPIAKLYTIGPMFRRERPQKGRLRQFHQIDVEILGYNDPRIDAELILMLVQFLKDVGLRDYQIEVNSLGCSSCRPIFREAIVDYLNKREWDLCQDCQRRLYVNPLRVFDCKVPSCGEIVNFAPSIKDYLCESCNSHFAVFCESLARFAIPYQVNAKMVRGLDYYTRTAFEITTTALGAQNAVAGGGRYDGLVKSLGGPDIPGIGFAVGMERLLEIIPNPPELREENPFLFIAALGELAQSLAYHLCNTLRINGIPVEMNYCERSLKSQLKRADKLRCPYTLIIGESEIQENKAILRDMRSSEQVLICLNDVFEKIQWLYREGKR